jgi:hypothetical protein
VLFRQAAVLSSASPRADPAASAGVAIRLNAERHPDVGQYIA